MIELRLILNATWVGVETSPVPHHQCCVLERWWGVGTGVEGGPAPGALSVGRQRAAGVAVAAARHAHTHAHAHDHHRPASGGRGAEQRR